MNIETMTKQEVFDMSAAHLIRQGVKSQDENGNCLYRGPNGTKCAAGIFIPDEKYDLDMEGKDWHYPGLYKIVSEKHDELISRLQSVHDDYSPIDWKSVLAQIANQFNLTTEVLKEPMYGI